jgi:hypothetical protein
VIRKGDLLGGGSRSRLASMTGLEEMLALLFSRKALAIPNVRATKA